MKAAVPVARAWPRAAFNSSTAPPASMRGSDFETRRLYIRPVSPRSPFLVAILTGSLSIQRVIFGSAKFPLEYLSRISEDDRDVSFESHKNYVIDEDITRIDWERVHAWLSGSYWSPGIPRERVERAGCHSALVLGAYLGGNQAGYLRVVSDTVRWAYLCDVWVDEGHRKKGLA